MTDKWHPQHTREAVLMAVVTLLAFFVGSYAQLPDTAAQQQNIAGQATYMCSNWYAQSLCESDPALCYDDEFCFWNPNECRKTRIRIAVACSDSDGGRVTGVAGTVKTKYAAFRKILGSTGCFYWHLTGHEYVEAQDRCLTAPFIWENYCDGNQGTYEVRICDYGCGDGRCYPPPGESETQSYVSGSGGEEEFPYME